MKRCKDAAFTRDLLVKAFRKGLLCEMLRTHGFHKGLACQKLVVVIGKGALVLALLLVIVLQGLSEISL